MKDCKLPDLDAYILGRMYDYAGHLIRAINTKPQHLTGQVLDFRNAEFKETLSTVVGHKCRVAPWNWERQYLSFFHCRGKDGKDTAGNRNSWQAYKGAWTKFSLRSRAEKVYLGTSVGEVV